MNNKKPKTTPTANKQTPNKQAANKQAKSKFIEYEHLDKIGEIALYYGFTPMKSPAITAEDVSAAKDMLTCDFVDDETIGHMRFPLHAEEKIASIRQYHEQNMHALPQPVMLYFKDPCRNSARKGCLRYADLEILGTSGAIAEATLIQTARAMLAEEKFVNTAVEINSIGDRDSMNRFGRELTAFYRKNINQMSPECRQLLKRDPFELLASKRADAIELNKQAPRSIDFLSEGSRRHLEEVLEYLEALDVPYVINNGLIGNRHYCTETVFTITDVDCTDRKTCEQHLLAVGVRYNGLAKRLNMKRDVQGVGISLLIKNNNNTLRKSLNKAKRPITSFVQLGLESKLLSLGIIEELRREKIPLFLSSQRSPRRTSFYSRETPYSLRHRNGQERGRGEERHCAPH